MRFSTLVASALTFLLAATSFTAAAPAPAPPGQLTELCKLCVQHTIISAVPACTIEMLDKGFLAFTVPTPQQRACFCPLSSTNTWFQSCLANFMTNGCNAVPLNNLYQTYVANRWRFCPVLFNAAAAAAPLSPQVVAAPAPGGPPTTIAPPAPAGSSTSVRPSIGGATATHAPTNSTAQPAPTTGTQGSAGTRLSDSSKIAAGATLAVVSALFLL
ncbi:hypothetical protein BGX29_000382 [Mortierella sp. GBA35]|nr:hypothetical protein BGX29_000382 [Mortierella sp. GBA35]